MKRIQRHIIHKFFRFHSAAVNTVIIMKHSITRPLASVRSSTWKETHYHDATQPCNHRTTVLSQTSTLDDADVNVRQRPPPISSPTIHQCVATAPSYPLWAASLTVLWKTPSLTVFVENVCRTHDNWNLPSTTGGSTEYKSDWRVVCMASGNSLIYWWQLE